MLLPTRASFAFPPIEGKCPRLHLAPDNGLSLSGGLLVQAGCEAGDTRTVKVGYFFSGLFSRGAPTLLGMLLGNTGPRKPESATEGPI